MTSAVYTNVPTNASWERATVPNGKGALFCPRIARAVGRLATTLSRESFMLGK